MTDPETTTDRPSGSTGRPRIPWWAPALVVAVIMIVVAWLWTQLPSAEALLDRAARARQRGDLKAAGELAEAAAARDPGLAPAWMFAAEMAGKQGNRERAVELYDSVREDATDEEVAQACTLAGFELLRRPYRAAEAEAHFRRALERQPDHKEANKAIAELFVISGRRWEASGFVLRLLERGSFRETQLAILDLESGTRFESLLFDQSRSSIPDDPLALCALADGALRDNRVDKAVELARRAIGLRPDMAAAHVILGRALVRTGRMGELLTWHAGLPASADEHPRAWGLRGEIARRRGEPAVAARCFAEALRRHADLRAANYRLAELLRDLDRADDARPFLERARQLQDLKEIDDLLVNAIGSERAELLKRKVLLLEVMGRAYEAWGWSRIVARFDAQSDWVRRIDRELTPVVTADPPPPLTLADANPAAKLDLADLPLPDWPRSGATPTNGVGVETGDGGVEVTFRDDAEASGLVFNYFNAGDSAEPGQKMYEFTGGGVAAIDYDRDGRPDLYLAQGCRWPPDDDGRQNIDRLFRQAGEGRFEDVTDQAGLAEPGFSQGVAVGDLDNDGFPDLFVGNIGGNRLFRNNGDGTFSDVTGTAGPGGDDWTTSVLVADLNGDSLPDLYEVNYLAGPDIYERVCRGVDGTAKMCQPYQFPAAPDRFYLNTGDGRFVEQARAAGLVAAGGKGLGIVAADLDGSGRLSLFVANDTRANFLFVNETPERGDRPRFVEQGLESGAGVNGTGRAEGCMGIAAGDVDGDGYLDLLVTNFLNESNTLYIGGAGGLFHDRTDRARLGESSRNLLGFGTQFLDADLDGRLDIMITNGHVDDYSAEGRPYRMPPQFYRNLGQGRFEQLDARGLGAHFGRRYLGRGLARLDWNLDGRPDVVISSLDIPVVLLTNTTPAHGNFLAVRLVGTHGDRDAIGTRLVAVAAGTTRVRQLTAGDGYLSSNHRRLVFGLGTAERVETLTVHWPSGLTQEFSNLAAGSDLLLVEGREGPVRVSKHLP